MNLCRVRKNAEAPLTGSAWTEVQEDELGRLLSTLSQLESEKCRLSVQLEAAQEALFTHQNKTRNLIDSLEEEMVQLKECLCRGQEREAKASLRISALEKALEDMQMEKHTLQKRNLCEAEAQVQSQTELRKEAEAESQRLSKELDLKSEENIELRMTILKVQEDLTKENHLQEKAIEERDRLIKELRETLSEIRLERDARSMSDLLTPDSDADVNSSGRHNWTRSQESTVSDSENEAQERHEEQLVAEEENVLNGVEEAGQSENREEEILRLREENRRLRTQLKRVQSQLQNRVESDVCCGLSNGDAWDKAMVGTSEEEKKEEESPRELKSDLQSQDPQCERLVRALRESQESAKLAQDRADHVTYLLNQKLIELNKLQLTLSSQTKEMIQLERAYFQLRSHLGRGSRSPKMRSRHDMATTSS